MSSKIITGQNTRAADWARPRLGLQCFEPGDKFTSLILERDLEIRAAVFYNCWVPGNSIDLHIAAVPGKRWMTPSFLRATFRYPFLELGVRRMGALVAADNADSLRLTRHVGFVQEGIAREGWAEGVDLIAFGMLRHECKWLDGPAPDIWSYPDYGKAVTASAPESNGYHFGAGSGEQRIGAAIRRTEPYQPVNPLGH